MLSVFAVFVALALLENSNSIKSNRILAWLEIIKPLNISFYALDVDSAQIKNPKIVGGADTNIKQIPWQAALLYNGRQICGGSIIDTNRILTAAHCVSDKNLQSYSVRIGATKRQNDGQTVKVSRIHAHANFNVVKNDIAVVILKAQLKFDKKIQSVKLPSNSNDLEEDTEVIISGWGVTEKHPSGANNLQMAIVKTIERQKCKKLIKKPVVDSGMICAGIPTTGGIDACQVRKTDRYAFITSEIHNSCISIVRVTQAVRWFQWKIKYYTGLFRGVLDVLGQVNPVFIQKLLHTSAG